MLQGPGTNIVPLRETASLFGADPHLVSASCHLPTCARVEIGVNDEKERQRACPIVTHVGQKIRTAACDPFAARRLPALVPIVARLGGHRTEVDCAESDGVNNTVQKNAGPKVTAADQID